MYTKHVTEICVLYNINLAVQPLLKIANLNTDISRKVGKTSTKTTNIHNIW